VQRVVTDLQQNFVKQIHQIKTKRAITAKRQTEMMNARQREEKEKNERERAKEEEAAHRRGRKRGRDEMSAAADSPPIDEEEKERASGPKQRKKSSFAVIRDFFTGLFNGFASLVKRRETDEKKEINEEERVDNRMDIEKEIPTAESSAAVPSFLSRMRSHLSGIIGGGGEGKLKEGKREREAAVEAETKEAENEEEGKEEDYGHLHGNLPPLQSDVISPSAVASQFPKFRPFLRLVPLPLPPHEELEDVIVPFKSIWKLKRGNILDKAQVNP